MQLSGTNLGAARVYHTILSGDRQEMKRLLAKAQDCATDAIAVLNSMTQREAVRLPFVSKVIDALERRGYGDKIRFKPEPKQEPTKKEREAAALAALKGMPFFNVLERKGLAGTVAKSLAAR